MPAVTPANASVLPRVTTPSDARFRPTKKVVAAHRAVEGEGFVVRRAFPGTLGLHDVDPFLLLDHMGSVDLAPGEAKGTPWHPHRGFETVTYIVDGALEHQDSTGGGGLIQDGATQWMTAGAGILHIEQPTELLVTQGGVLHGVQLWVNLPADKKMTAPRYQDIDADVVSLVASGDGGAVVRIIAGQLGGYTGPGTTHTPITYAHASIEPGMRLDLPWRSDFSAMAYVLSGSGTAGPDGAPIDEAHLAIFGDGDGDAITLTASGSQAERSPRLEVLLLGGKPLRQPIAHYGPFVMNTRDEIVTAIEDFQSGRMGRIPATGLRSRASG